MGKEKGSWGLDIRKLLVSLGEDVEREGLLETPTRVERAWKELLEGYTLDIDKIFDATFEAEGTGIQACKNIAFTSMCEHHLLAFYGYTHICYSPDTNVVGLSKLSRLVDCFTRRLQIQERMTQQIADTLYEHLKPKGVFVLVEAVHLCCKGRGIRSDRMVFATTAMNGCIDLALCTSMLGNRNEP